MTEAGKTLSRFQKELKTISNFSQLEKLKINYLGRKGKINQLLKRINEVPPYQKKVFGQEINNLKQTILYLLGKKRKELRNKKQEKAFFDPTLPGKKYPKGSLHPVSFVINEISEIFKKIGFIRLSYPEIEWEYFAFDALNMPPKHPARDDFETFFIDFPPHPQYGRLILSPHTSSGQVREMLRVKKPPIRMINIAKCYRPNWDTTHTPMFHQFEGLCIDKEINMTHLKGAINYFVKEFFGKERKIRLRPFHFQFTEPSFEIDINCGVCNGKGVLDKKKCPVCKSGWLELAGAGMVHPNVLKAGKIDPDVYSGWAFGMGIERILMMREEINLNDLRIMYSNDIRFLEQF